MVNKRLKSAAGRRRQSGWPHPAHDPPMPVRSIPLCYLWWHQ